MLLLATACGGGGGGGGGAVDPSVLCTGDGTRFAGFVQYQDRPYSTQGFASPVNRPVRYAKVAMIDGSDGVTVLGSTTTDAGGAYCIDVDAGLYPTSAKLRVRTVAEPPQALNGGTISVAPDGLSAHVYEVTSNQRGVIDRIVNRVPNFVITPDTRMPIDSIHSVPVLGAFNIMDVAAYGYEAIHTVWGVRLPALNVEWRYDLATGTRYTPDTVTIHINGNAGGDSDEFDDDTVLHEFGHFVYHQVGWHDSPGGQHFINGYTQDARLAYSEGWASFLSGMIRDLLPAAASNRSGPEWMISAFTLTEGSVGALAWAYDMDRATATVPDMHTANYDTSPTDPAFFQNRVKTTTSEVSVSAALWDIYRGVPGTEGIGAAGIYDALLAMKGNGLPTPQTFGAFWEFMEWRHQADPSWLADMRAHLSAERRMGLVDDAFGADDTPAELSALSPGSEHDIQGVSETRPIVLPALNTAQFTLFPFGDADLYRFRVDTAGTYGIVTYGLSNGADTYLELLDATGAQPVLDGQGVALANDNYELLGYRYWYGTVDGVMFDTLILPQDYGNCGLVAVTVQGGKQKIYLPGCPLNASNYPGQIRAFRITEYLASRIDAALAPGDYVIRVTRPAGAPPSADIYGGYRLCVENKTAASYIPCPRYLTQ